MKIHSLGKLVILAVMVFFIMSSLSPVQIASEKKQAGISENDFEIDYTMTFATEDLIFSTLMGYDTVGLRDGTCINAVGMPMIPAKEIKIALPAGMTVQNVQATDAQYVVIDGEYMIFPAQPPRRTNGLNNEVPFVQPDRRIYNSMDPYPSTLLEFVHQTDLAGQGIAVIHLYPVQYIPATKKLIVYTAISFVIEGVSGYVCGDYLPHGISDSGRNTYEQMIKDMVVNPEDVNLDTNLDEGSMPLGLPPGGPYDHVIITSSSYESYWTPLVEWHTRRGLKDTVVTTSYIYSNYGGADNQEKIRNFVIDAHTTWGCLYFLLAGEHGTVPFKYTTYYQEFTPSDQYYSDYDGDWTHEVFVGRSTAEGSTQINCFINKVLYYEKTPPTTGYPLDVLLVGMDLDASTHAEYLKETIDGYIPARFRVTKVYDSYGGCLETAVINALNAGQNLVNHADHGWYDFMGTGGYQYPNCGLSNSEVDGLNNNGQLSVVVSLACDSNGMDYASFDSISEHFVIYNSNQAGVAFTGNTRSGWAYIGYPEELSGKLDKEWWRGLFSYDTYILGETLVWSKHQFSTGWPDADVKQHCEWTFNLLGEPAMPIWTDTPATLTVIHDTTINTGSQSFNVHVYSSGNVQGATVCLWKGDEVYEVGTTDASGWAYFAINPSTEGTMHVTVTKHNYIPYLGETEVTLSIPGDCDGDGDVDQSDLGILLAAWDSHPGDPNWDERADIDGDDYVGQSDLGILLSNWGYGT